MSSLHILRNVRPRRQPWHSQKGCAWSSHCSLLSLHRMLKELIDYNRQVFLDMERPVLTGAWISFECTAIVSTLNTSQQATSGTVFMYWLVRDMSWLHYVVSKEVNRVLLACGEGGRECPKNAWLYRIARKAISTTVTFIWPQTGFWEYCVYDHDYAPDFVAVNKGISNITLPRQWWGGYPGKYPGNYPFSLKGQKRSCVAIRSKLPLQEQASLGQEIPCSNR